MQRDVWRRLVTLVRRLAASPSSRRFSFREAEIVLVYFWAAEHTRPVYWACRPDNWPDHLRPARLPTPATMSRRLRRPGVHACIDAVRRHQQRGLRRSLLSTLDGKPLPVSHHSRDRDARFGRGAGALAKGYKFHGICNGPQRLEAWTAPPLNVDERVVARRLVPASRIAGYLLADRYYDDNLLHDTCLQHGVQLVAPRRYGPHKGLGHHRHSPARRRCIDMLEHSHTGFGPALHARRGDIERRFGALASAWYGLGPLPAWVRGQHRVELWVAAKLALFQLHQSSRKRRR
jgi:hypothetical protein